MLQNIPQELREYRQFVCWRFEYEPDKPKPKKIPLDPKTGYRADTTNPATWADFETANAAFANGLCDGIGFVLSENDPYVFIDLDETDNPAERAIQEKIVDAFPGYAEISPSGKGLHIIARGSVPTGRKRAHIEVYSSARYMTMTGNVYRAEQIQIANPDILLSLWQELGGERVNGFTLPEFTASVAETLRDDEIYNSAAAASNGELFINLWAGKWQNDYPSQSEADQALCNFLAFYTHNPKQITRMFHGSQLGKREKAFRKDYLENLLARALDRAFEVFEFPEFMAQGWAILNAQANIEYEREQARIAKITASQRERLIRQAEEHAPNVMAIHDFSAASAIAPPPELGKDFPPPPGLVGEIAKFVYAQSPYPVQRIALTASLAFVAALCGRAFNVNGIGCNNYLLLISDTASGKEAMQSGISKLIGEVSKTCPNAKSYFGPANIASGQALYRVIKERRTMLTIQSEFGKRLSEMSGPRANAALQRLMQAYLELYTKSGKGQTLGADAFADKEKDTSDLESPALSILAETAPPHLYDNLNETMLSDGFLPRFTVIEQDGARDEFQPKAFEVMPSQKLVHDVAKLAEIAISTDAKNGVIDVRLTEEADRISDAYRATCRKIATDSHKDSIKQLWSRAHVKVLKLSALLAIGTWFERSTPFPRIELDHIQWAVSIVNDGTKRLIDRFTRGAIGDGDERAYSDAMEAIKRYLNGNQHTLPKSFFDPNAHAQGIISYGYLRNQLANLASYRNGIGGSTSTVSRIIVALMNSGVLEEIDHAQTKKAGMQGKFFKIHAQND